MSTSPVAVAGPPSTLGSRLHRAMKYAGIQVQALADELGYHRGTITRWLADSYSEPPRKVVMEKIAVICGVDVVWLMYGLGEPPPASPYPKEWVEIVAPPSGLEPETYRSLSRHEGKIAPVTPWLTSPDPKRGTRPASRRAA